jgi:GDSL-like Lipase/Acylhydrolase family
MQAAPRKSRIVRLCMGLALAAGTLVLLEGFASLFLFAYDLAFNTRSSASEREAEYTQFDPEIGWISRPDVRVPDLFGPGASLSTDSLGARGSAAVAREVPPGKLRVVCVGDSFTQGYGVGDEATWPSALQALDPRLEVVNLGQRGYGIDQAYLWYLRKADEIEHDVVLLAFIADDWRRVRLARYQGYPKPLLEPGAGAPRVTNSPLEAPRSRSGWWQLNREVLESPRSVALLERVARKLGMKASEDTALSERRGAEVVAQLVGDLDQRCRAAGRRLALVYLPSPVPGSAGGITQLGGEARRVCEEARADGIAFLDLTPAFLALAPEKRDGYFLKLSEVAYPWAQNHYDADGNRFVAETLHEQLELLGLLSGPDRPR